MIDWTEEQQAVRDAVRRFVEAEIAPHRGELEHGDTPPYEILRKFVRSFGIADMQRSRALARIEKEKRAAAPEPAEGPRESEEDGGASGDRVALQLIPVIEISRYCPGMVTALGVSMGLTAQAILSRGTIAQKETFAVPLLTLEKIGAWAITEPGSGSDAFGAMKSTARCDGDQYVLNGSKTFITNGPYADTIVFICKLADGTTPEERKIVSFILDRGTPGLTQGPPLRKMGLHSSPTGELHLQDVRVPRDRLMGGRAEGYGRSGARETFGTERTGVVAMALGIVERCLELCVEYSKNRVQFGRPIGEFQLIQLKLARMEVARTNIQNMLFRQIEMARLGRRASLAEASACKLYAAQATMEVCLEAVQLFGGNGYMAEYQVEQLCRDAKVLQIYAGTDEIQVREIARGLLGG